MGCLVREVALRFELPLTALSTIPLPPLLSETVGVLHLCHYMGRVWYRIESRMNAPIQHIAGVLMNSVYGDNRFMRVVAHVVAVAKELFGVIEEGRHVLERWKRVVNICITPTSFLSSYSVNRLNYGVLRQSAFSRISIFLGVVLSSLQLLVLRIVEIAAAIWRLNLHLFALYDALWLDPSSQAASVDDFFINVGDVAGQILGPERRLIKAVTEYQGLVDTVLHMVHIDCSSQVLIDRLDEIASGADRMRSAFQGPAERLGMVCSGMAEISSKVITIV